MENATEPTSSMESLIIAFFCFFFSSRRRHTRLTCDWSSDVCSSDLFQDSGISASYTFDKQDKNLSATMVILDNHVDSTWYGTKTYHNEIEYKSRNLHIFTHTIEADRPIDVQFIGAAQGSVSIASDAAVRLRGPVLNPSGTTTITAATQIVQEGPEAILSG